MGIKGFLGFWNSRAPAGCVHCHKSLFNFTLRTANEKLRRQSSCITKSTVCLAENMPFHLTQRLWGPEPKATVVSGPGGMVWRGMQAVHNRPTHVSKAQRTLPGSERRAPSVLSIWFHSFEYRGDPAPAAPPVSSPARVPPPPARPQQYNTT